MKRIAASNHDWRVALAVFCVSLALVASAQAQAIQFNARNVAQKVNTTVHTTVPATPATAPAAPEAAKTVQFKGTPIITTIEGEQIEAPLASLADGKLTLGLTPPRVIELDEIDRIQLLSGPSLSLVWIGQDNSDLAQAGPVAGGNKIPDLHLRLDGLPTQRQIKQIVATSKDQNIFLRLFGKGGTTQEWRLDPEQSAAWRLVIDRAEEGRSRIAEIYMEPEAADSFEREYTFLVTYDDNTTNAVAVHATTHTKNMAEGAEAPAATATATATATFTGTNSITVVGVPATVTLEAAPVQAAQPVAQAAPAAAPVEVKTETKIETKTEVKAEDKAAPKTEATPEDKKLEDKKPADKTDEKKTDEKKEVKADPASGATATVAPPKAEATKEAPANAAAPSLTPVQPTTAPAPIPTTAPASGYAPVPATSVPATTTATPVAVPQAAGTQAAGIQPTATPAPPPPNPNEPEVVVFLEGRDMARGRLLAVDEESLTIHAPWHESVKIPLLKTLAIRFTAVTSADAQSQFDKQRRGPSDQDLAFIVSADGLVNQVGGSVKKLEAGKLMFEVDGKERPINLVRLSGLVFAAHPTKRTNQGASQVFKMGNGDVITGVWKGIDGESLVMETAWGSSLSVDKKAIEQILTRNGRMVYLSDLDPLATDEIPFFGQPRPFVRDRSLSGAPLRIAGKDFAKGLAVHSRSRLSYALDGQYDSFLATVGFDDAAKGRGAVVLRVMADDKELIAKPSFRGSEEPLALDLPVSGAKQLTLEIDFGDAEDIGDRVIWGSARVARKKASP